MIHSLLLTFLAPAPSASCCSSCSVRPARVVGPVHRRPYSPASVQVVVVVVVVAVVGVEYLTDKV